ncbi:serine/threonine-protein phosphatase 6 regulatory subunit 2 [Clonorchis sinensis]|uniref:Serine/threonine-protein phosphatase 6 regulatory subunit 2 n=1 Tax=Clonorchis sinensis TaxID=79923 RepID=G7YEH5_CLOSI|nr:serine/threonine-protein phosphatase 6 regulatory subunit 2 [Clonorchis sinensis]
MRLERRPITTVVRILNLTGDVDKINCDECGVTGNSDCLYATKDSYLSVYNTVRYPGELNGAQRWTCKSSVALNEIPNVYGPKKSQNWSMKLRHGTVVSCYKTLRFSSFYEPQALSVNQGECQIHCQTLSDPAFFKVYQWHRTDNIKGFHSLLWDTLQKIMETSNGCTIKPTLRRSQRMLRAETGKLTLRVANLFPVPYRGKDCNPAHEDFILQIKFNCVDDLADHSTFVFKVMLKRVIERVHDISIAKEKLVALRNITRIVRFKKAVILVVGLSLTFIMFWSSIAAQSLIDDLLSRPDLTIQELLDDDNVLQKCREKDSRLIDFLCRDDNIDYLVDLISQPYVSEEFDKCLYRYNHCTTSTRFLQLIMMRMTSRLEHFMGPKEEFSNVLTLTRWGLQHSTDPASCEFVLPCKYRRMIFTGTIVVDGGFPWDITFCGN